MNSRSFMRFHNGEVIDPADIPLLDCAFFRSAVIHEVESGGRLNGLFIWPREGRTLLLGIVGHAETGSFAVLSAPVTEAYPALTPDCPQAHWFEREIAEQYGIRPEGHPWLKPIRFHDPYGRGPEGKDRTGAILPAVTDFFQVSGEEVHEVAVGPVHAGIIEPGHFRFQCHGEKVLHLEIALGFQHRGVEKALLGGPDKRTVHYMETLAGDTTVGHTTAYAQAVESLNGCRVTARAQALRGIALELERLANHIGDLGAVAGDIGYLPTASFCGRIRGDFLNMTALVCGNRFGRGWIKPGGVGFDLDEERAAALAGRVKKGLAEAADAFTLLQETPSVRARLEDTGTLPKKTARDLGLVGPAARACGLRRDVRFEFPSGIYTVNHIPLSTWEKGDVFARVYVRWLEIQKSADFIMDQLQSLPAGPVFREPGLPVPSKMVVSLVEGWRGEICHAAITGPDRRFAGYKIIDPSFHNWMGLALALRNQQISDFPLCNKSFNLSYCGHDL